MNICYFVIEGIITDKEILSKKNFVSKNSLIFNII